MRFAVWLLVLGCSSPAKTSESTTPTATAAEPTSATPTARPAATAATATPPPAGSARPSNTGKAQYSCFSYVSRNSTVKRYACMRTDECGPYLEQAKSVGGIRELSGCANVPAVYCFHQVGTKDEPEGLDVCQPSLDECKTARADVVRAKMSVDSDCARP